MDKVHLLASIDSIDRLGIAFCMVAATGAVGLAYVAVVHWRLGNQLQDIELVERRTHEAAIASIKADAEKTAERVAEANERAAKANERAEEASARIAEANRVAEEERHARMKIEERIAPRILTAEQLAGIKARVEPFASGATRVAFLASSDSEPAHIGKPLLDTLRDAGWMVSNAWGHNIARAVGGIFVEVSVDADTSTKEAAVALVAAIRAACPYFVIGPAPLEQIEMIGQFVGEGRPVVKTFQELDAQLRAATIRITIGPK